MIRNHLKGRLIFYFYLGLFFARFTLGIVTFNGVTLRNGLLFHEHLVKVALFLLQIQHLCTLRFQFHCRVLQFSLLIKKKTEKKKKKKKN